MLDLNCCCVDNRSMDNNRDPSDNSQGAGEHPAFHTQEASGCSGEGLVAAFEPEDTNPFDRTFMPSTQGPMFESPVQWGIFSSASSQQQPIEQQPQHLQQQQQQQHVQEYISMSNRNLEAELVGTEGSISFDPQISRSDPYSTTIQACRITNNSGGTASDYSSPQAQNRFPTSLVQAVSLSSHIHAPMMSSSEMMMNNPELIHQLYQQHPQHELSNSQQAHAYLGIFPSSSSPATALATSSNLSLLGYNLSQQQTQQQQQSQTFMNNDLQVGGLSQLPAPFRRIDSSSTSHYPILKIDSRPSFSMDPNAARSSLNERLETQPNLQLEHSSTVLFSAGRDLGSNPATAKALPKSSGLLGTEDKVTHSGGGASGGGVPSGKTSTRNRRAYCHEPFPHKLFRLLEDVEKEGKSDIVSFTTSGTSFHIHKPDEFLKDIVPKYFRQKQFSSFKRQLSMYGFERIFRKGPEEGAFFHKNFQRGRPDLCQLIERVGHWGVHGRK